MMIGMNLYMELLLEPAVKFCRVLAYLFIYLFFNCLAFTFWFILNNLKTLCLDSQLLSVKKL